MICQSCESETPHTRNRKYCPECANRIHQAHKRNWSASHREYHRNYLRKWRKELDELIRSIG